MELVIVHFMWIPVTTAWCDLWLRKEEGSPDMEESWE